MKKRTLLASVALLVVAVMALATASYAWFTAGTDTTAQGISINASAGSSLLIKGDDDSEYTSIGTTTSSNTTMSPATASSALRVSNTPAPTAGFMKLSDAVYVNSAADYRASTSATSEVAITAANLVDASADATRYVGAKYSLWNTDTAAAADVSVSFKNTFTGNLWKSLRVAIFTSTTAAPVAVLAPTGAASNSLSDWTPVTVTGTTAANAFQVAAGAKMDVYVLAWFEGQDSACITNNVNVTTTALQLSFTI